LTDTAFSQGGYDDTWLRLKARYQNGKILLIAAIAKLQNGQLQICRVVIDGGSQVNLISRRMADLLSLKEMSPIEISGIGGKITTITAIRSTLNSHQLHQALKHY